MVETDVGDDRNQRVDDICAVEPTAESHFNDGNVDIIVAEILERHLGGNLKEGQSDFLEEILALFHEVDNILLSDGYAVDAYAFAEVEQMRRGVESHLVAAHLQDGRQRMRHRAFTVRAGYVNALEVLVRHAVVLVYLPHVVQSGFVAVLSLTLVVGRLVEQVFAGLLVCHLFKKNIYFFAFF